MDATQISTKKRKRKHSGSRDATTDGAKDKKIRKKEKLERKRKKEKKAQGEDEGEEVEEAQKADEEGGEKEVKALSSGKTETSGGGGGDRGSENDGEEENNDGEEENNEVDEDDTPKHPDADTGTKSNDIPLSSSLSLPIVGESPVKFTDLNLSDATQKAIAAMGFEKMTDVQSRTIPPLMAGRDV